MKIREMSHWIWRGKSIARAHMNTLVQQKVRLNGRILDIGGGGEPSYKPSLINERITEWITIGINCATTSVTSKNRVFAFSEIGKI